MKKRQYFHTLDALRFIFFIFVFLFHSSSSDNAIANLFLKKGGVTFFFVLSGFLITYILLFEKTQTNNIDLKRFFKRRGLRIYPLFYALILFAYLSPFILDLIGMQSSNEGYEPNILISLLFLENYHMMFTRSFPDGAPLRVMWSLCVSEHFYIIWSAILFWFSVQKIPYFLGFGLLLSTACRFVYAYYDIPQIDILTNFDYFLFGAIPAYLLIEKPRFVDYIEKVPLSIKYMIAIIAVLFPKHILGTFTPFVLGMLFSLLLVFTLSPRNAIKIDNRWWISKLGKYTYGMYLYHTIFILLISQLLRKFMGDIHWIITSIVALMITVVVSMISYHVFEKPILDRKKKYK